MKTLLSLITTSIIATSLHAQDTDTRPGHPTQQMVVKGKYFYHAHLDQVGVDKAVIVHDFGKTTVKWSNLPAEVQQEYQAEHNTAVAGDPKSINARFKAAGAEYLFGRVVSKLPSGGVLLQLNDQILCVKKLPNEANLADGDFAGAFWAAQDGTVEYRNTLGSNVTVHAFRFVAAYQKE